MAMVSSLAVSYGVAGLRHNDYPALKDQASKEDPSFALPPVAVVHVHTKVMIMLLLIQSYVRNSRGQGCVWSCLIHFFVSILFLQSSDYSNRERASPEVIKLFQCSTQLSMKFILLINVKMPTIVGILTLISMINTTSEGLKAINFFICRFFSFYEQL